MSPPRWVDDDGRRVPDTPLPDVWPRDPGEATEGGAGARVPSAPLMKCLASSSGARNGVEVILVPEGDGRLSELLVIGQVT